MKESSTVYPLELFAAHVITIGRCKPVLILVHITGIGKNPCHMGLVEQPAFWV